MPLVEQKLICKVLDAKCAEIDAVLDKTRTSIEEYKKLKQAIITQAVTKGIRGDRPMKEEVFEQRIREYTPNMYRLAYGILQNHEDAQDAVGETILRAFEKIHTLRRPECFRTWLMQITANEAKKIYAGNKRLFLTRLMYNRDDCPLDKISEMISQA